MSDFLVITFAVLACALLYSGVSELRSIGVYLRERDATPDGSNPVFSRAELAKASQAAATAHRAFQKVQTALNESEAWKVALVSRSVTPDLRSKMAGVAQSSVSNDALSQDLSLMMQLNLDVRNGRENREAAAERFQKERKGGRFDYYVEATSLATEWEHRVFGLAAPVSTVEHAPPMPAHME